jgi:hypothetical protein
MRHLYGTGLAVVLAAAVFFGGSWGYYRLLLRNFGSAWSLPAGGGSFLGNSTVTTGLAAVAATALLAGLLIAIRWVSPLATGIPGLVLLAWTVLYVFSPARAVHDVPLKSHSFGLGFAALGTTGVLGAAGIALVMPLFYPSRWRRPATADDDYDEAAPTLEATTVTGPVRTGLTSGMGSSAWKEISVEATQTMNVKKPGAPPGW